MLILKIMKDGFLSAFILFLLFFFWVNSFAQSYQLDSVNIKENEIINLDSLLNVMEKEKIIKVSNSIIKAPNESQSKDSFLYENFTNAKDTFQNNNFHYTFKNRFDSLLYWANPFFIDLVYMGFPLDFKWTYLSTDLRTLYYGQKATTLSENAYIPIKKLSLDEILFNLRQEARNEITRTDLGLYKKMFNELSNPYVKYERFIKVKPVEKVEFVEEKNYHKRYGKKIPIPEFKISPWRNEGRFLLQFSENYISENWYQGGNSNLTVLSILSGKWNYDDKSKIQWDNTAEWRIGFYSVFKDTTALRNININEDILKITSKFGYKASGNWYYSGSLDFATQFLKNYQSISSNEMKAAFLTPIRLNVNFGMDYKYKKMFSFMFSPISLKYIYAKDTLNIDPNLFGIEKGKNRLIDFGNSLNAVLSYSPNHETQIDSKLTFYTNYKKVEIDWEIVGNFVINRFLSTRISLHPRYDNTIILAEGQRAKLQFKQLLSIGFSRKF